ncbi:MAG: S8 family serine peptidase [Nitrososphaeraceae archaeon]
MTSNNFHGGIIGLRSIILFMVVLVLLGNIITVNAQPAENNGVEGVITINKNPITHPSDGLPGEPVGPSSTQPQGTFIQPIDVNQTKKVNVEVGGKKIPFQDIVVLKDEIANNTLTLKNTFSALTMLVENFGAEIIYTYNSTVAGFAFKAPNQQIFNQLTDVLRVDPRVREVEQDRTVVPFSEESSTGLHRIDAIFAPADSKIGSTGVNSDIAIIDSGVDLSHPDLNVFRNTSAIIPQNVTSIHNTLAASNIDLEKIGLNTLNLGKNRTAFYPPFSQNINSAGDDECGHGTSVAGIAAAKHNSFGIIGVAPGARLWSIKVLDWNNATKRCEGSISSVIAAIDYVTKHANQIDVTNLSLGCKCNSSALDEAIHRSVAANVTYVVAAGNIHADASSFSPANNTEVITVSAIADQDGRCGATGIPLWVDAGNSSGFSDDDTFARFSNYGSVVDIAAPGVKINSTSANGTYALTSGTSIAAPFVTGAAALYKSLNPHTSLLDIRDALTRSGSSLKTICDGSGRGYFKDDPDQNPEPLLDLGNLLKMKNKAS